VFGGGSDISKNIISVFLVQSLTFDWNTFGEEAKITGVKRESTCYCSWFICCPALKLVIVGSLLIQKYATALSQKGRAKKAWVISRRRRWQGQLQEELPEFSSSVSEAMAVAAAEAAEAAERVDQEDVAVK
jgi:hypothetical protein